MFGRPCFFRVGDDGGKYRRVLSVAHHPFIVGMDYAFQTPELGIMCLELVTGGDLQVRLCLDSGVVQNQSIGVLHDLNRGVLSIWSSYAYDAPQIEC